MARLPMVFPGFMILGAFNLLSLAAGLEVAQEFMATMTSMGLPQVIQSLTQNSSPTPDLVFLLKQCQGNLDLGEWAVFLLSGSDHSLVGVLPVVLLHPLHAGSLDL